MNESQHSQFGEPEWGGRKVTLSISQHLMYWSRSGWGGTRQEGNVKQHKQIGFTCCSRVGRGSRAALPAEPVWGDCLQGSVAEMSWVLSCDPAHPAPSISVPFPEGRISVFQSFIIPVYLNFKSSKEQIVLSCIFQWHVGGAGTIPGWNF